VEQMSLLTYDAIHKINKRPEEPLKEEANDEITILDKNLEDAYSKIT